METKKCSREYRKTGKIVKCSQCGKDVYKTNSRLLRNTNSFCSHGCYGKYLIQFTPKEQKEKQREYYRNNREAIIKKFKIYGKEYRKNNQEKVANWLKNNPIKVKEINKRRNTKRRVNPIFKLSDAISRSIIHSLKHNKGGKHWESLLNYTIQDLIFHLGKQFKDGMSWQNIGKWHVDHIKPISSFIFNSYNDPEFKECWDLNNLQPLWAIENLRKSNKII